MSLIISTDSNFKNSTQKGLVLVDFWAVWCGPCQVMLPRLEELAKKVEGKAIIMKHNVDEEPQTPSEFRIMSIPTMILFKDGSPVEKFVGVQSVDDLVKAIEKHSTDVKSIEKHSPEASATKKTNIHKKDIENS